MGWSRNRLPGTTEKVNGFLNKELPYIENILLETKLMQIALVLLVIFLDHVGLGLVYPMFSSMLFHADSSFVPSEVSMCSRGWFLGILLAAPAITSFFSGPVLGAVSDQKGRRPLYVISLSLCVLGYGFCVIGIAIKSLLVLIVGRSITGIAMGNAAVVSATIADLSDEQTKTKNFGLYCMASGIGFATGPFVGAWLTTFGLIVPFCAASFATLVNLLLIAVFFKETNAMRKAGQIKMIQGIRNLKAAFRMSNLRVLFAAVCFFCLGWSLFYEFMPVVWITDYNFSTSKVGLIFAFGSGVFAFSSGCLIRPIVDHCKPYPILLSSFFAIGCCMLAPLFCPPDYWIWGYVALVNFFVALAFPTYTTVVSDSVGRNAQGEILGILESIQGAAFGLSPLLAGWLLGAHLRLPTALGAIFLFVAVLFLILGVNNGKKSFK